MPDRLIPAFVNPESGSSSAALDALNAAGHFSVERCDAKSFDRQIDHAVRAGAERIAIAGGDGTVARAAAQLVGTRTALAVVPGGTLNHFARDHGIPTDPEDAARAAATGPVVATDVAYVNDQLFLNTSSVGAYVLFVRTRTRLQHRVGYRIATLIAAIRLLGRVRPFTIEIEVGGAVRRYDRTALVFVGVGERELQLPVLGGRKPAGRRGLHVFVVRGGTSARLVAMGLTAILRGSRAVARGSYVDSFIVDRCRIELRRPEGRAAVDGEVVELRSPLAYRIERDALRLVVPEPRD